MNLIAKITVPVVAGLIALGCETGSGSKTSTPITTFDDSVSYSLGMDIAESIKGFGDSLKIDLVLEGLKANFNDEKLRISEKAAKKVRTKYMTAQRKAFNDKRDSESKKNLEAGNKFLNENGKKEGVITTKSGLQYKVLKQGKGKKPTIDDKVKVNYKGSLLNGKEFDNSYKRGKPLTIGIKGVIPGWTEVLQLMSVGSKYKVWIPSKLAYGPRGAGQAIGPNETLVFEIELLGIEK